MSSDDQGGHESSVMGLLVQSITELDAAGVAESKLKAETLLARAIGCRRLDLPLRRLHSVDMTTRSDFLSSIERLRGGEPLQYILGDVEFMGHRLIVDERVLIPRPETEELVEAVLQCKEVWSLPSVRVVDVGTGSGCIAIGLALARPAVEIVATDRCTDALDVARGNASRLGVEACIRFIHCDLVPVLEEASVDVVVSNPPYVRTDEWQVLPREIRDFEPRVALDGGVDGLCIISRLVPEAVHALKSGGWLFIETGAEQAVQVADRMAQDGFRRVAVRKDMAGRNRIVHGRKP